MVYPTPGLRHYIIDIHELVNQGKQPFNPHWNGDQGYLTEIVSLTLVPDKSTTIMAFSSPHILFANCKPGME